MIDFFSNKTFSIIFLDVFPKSLMKTAFSLAIVDRSDKENSVGRFQGSTPVRTCSQDTLAHTKAHSGHTGSALEATGAASIV